MSDYPDREQVTATVDRLVEELLDKAGIQAPPVDAIALAQKHLGMVVCLDKRQQQRGRAQRAGGREQIYLRPERTEERHQWTVAHEIGEHVKADLLERLAIAPEHTRGMTGESLANLFASRLLVPTRCLAADGPACGFDVLALKERYGTSSHEVIAWRLLDLSEPCIITIVDNARITRRRSNSWPVRSKRLEPVEQQCQCRVHKHSRPLVVRDGGWTVQGWPVHQADWKREILRSVVEVGE
jgi:Zn-dependent peptidase ImmA (M78 family)